jgi:uncharacterized protein YjbK
VDQSSDRSNRPARADPIEREIKLGLADAQAFARLVAAVGGERSAPVRQRNQFFDTTDLALRAQGIGLRLRAEDRIDGAEARYTATLKGRSGRSPGAAFSERSELECPLPPATAKAVLAGLASPTELLDALSAAYPAHPLLQLARGVGQRAPLVRLGGFENLRRSVEVDLAAVAQLAGQPPLQVVLELDHCVFAPDQERFEVELELGVDEPAEVAERTLRALFARLDLTPIPVSSKLAQFLALRAGSDSATGSPSRT